MLDCEFDVKHGIATVTLAKSRFGFSTKMSLEATLTKLEQLAPNGIIFDASGLSKMSSGMLGGLFDAILRLERGRAFRTYALALAVCGLPRKTMALVTAQGLDRLLPLFATVADAMRDPSFKSIQLRGVRGVVLCANQGTRLAPLTSDQPVAMLDFLGRPIVEHVLEHAAKFGVRDFVLNPGFCAKQLCNFAHSYTAGSVFCVNESTWQKSQSNDVSTLVQLQKAHGEFLGDTFVMQSSVLSDLDLADMMRFHKKTGADATIAVAKNRRASACDSDGLSAEEHVSAILISPHAAEALVKQNHMLRETMLIRALRAAHLNVQVFVSDHDTVPIKCGADYYASQAAVLNDGAFGISPKGEHVSSKVWVDTDAKIDPKIEVEGPCYIGPKAQVSRGVVLKGTNVVGARSVLRKNSVVSNSIIASDTEVGKNVFVDHMITNSHWSISHKFADGSLQNRAVLDGIKPANGLVQTQIQRLQKVSKIA